MAEGVFPIEKITETLLSGSLLTLSDVNRKIAITIKNHSPETLDQPDLYFSSGTSDYGLPTPIPSGKGLVWGARKISGPYFTGTVGVIVYQIKNQNKSLAFAWSIPFNYIIYSNWWAIQVYDGYITPNSDLFDDMSKNVTNNKGDSRNHQGSMNFGWRYEGSVGDSGTPFAIIDIYKD
ncbi:6303_t:CDS:2 [Entrophospora sp. SA101]|nr:3693_t:CDS:2 [Entrophospora sp. SA101]CAJ0630413.1 5190_t:CDS:2 [Entrophospora sp. SA101]CAJ0746135.1 20936_t:CDS:2 [Entrophospora sp. SA101]CAJ0746137.1 20938_t:CDS:2 [Entrophospora sp. SA101]CAJ0753698.1 6303_t:CDS:2 [Entrophospora sp. SA101]